MKRNDLRAMGLTPDQIDTIMTMNGADINREKAKAGQQTDKEVQRLRESCITLLELLDNPEAVRGILLHASACTVSRSAGSRRRASSEGEDNLHPRAGKRRTGHAGRPARDVSGGKST